MRPEDLDAARRLTLASLRALETSDRALQRVLLGESWEAALQAYIDDVRAAREHCEALERLLLARLQADSPPR